MKKLINSILLLIVCIFGVLSDSEAIRPSKLFGGSALGPVPPVVCQNFQLVEIDTLALDAILASNPQFEINALLNRWYSIYRISGGGGVFTLKLGTLNPLAVSVSTLTFASAELPSIVARASTNELFIVSTSGGNARVRRFSDDGSTLTQQQDVTFNALGPGPDILTRNSPTASVLQDGTFLFELRGTSIGLVYNRIRLDLADGRFIDTGVSPVSNGLGNAVDGTLGEFLSASNATSVFRFTVNPFALVSQVALAVTGNTIDSIEFKDDDTTKIYDSPRAAANIFRHSWPGGAAQFQAPFSPAESAVFNGIQYDSTHDKVYFVTGEGTGTGKVRRYDDVLTLEQTVDQPTNLTGQDCVGCVELDVSGQFLYILGRDPNNSSIETIRRWDLCADF